MWRKMKASNHRPFPVATDFKSDWGANPGIFHLVHAIGFEPILDRPSTCCLCQLGYACVRPEGFEPITLRGLNPMPLPLGYGRGIWAPVGVLTPYLRLERAASRTARRTGEEWKGLSESNRARRGQGPMPDRPPA